MATEEEYKNAMPFVSKSARKEAIYELLDEFDDDDDVEYVLDQDVSLERMEELEMLRAILNQV